MCYYMLTTGGQRKLQHHVVIGIGQERPPQKMNLLQMALTDKIAGKGQSVLWRQARRQIFLPRQDLLPFGVKAYGEARLKLRRRDQTHERETCAATGERRRYQDVRVEHNSHRSRIAHDKIINPISTPAPFSTAALRL